VSWREGQGECFPLGGAISGGFGGAAALQRRNAPYAAKKCQGRAPTCCSILAMIDNGRMPDYRLTELLRSLEHRPDGAFVNRIVTVGEIGSMVLELLEYRAAPEAALTAATPGETPMPTGTPFGKLTKAELKIHAYAWNHVGVTPVHRLKNGKYLRRYSRGWTRNPAPFDPVCATYEEAEAARRASIARRA